MITPTPSENPARPSHADWALVAIGLCWSASLVVAGAALLHLAAVGAPIARTAIVVAGFVALAAAQLVFATTVADKLCPTAGRIVGPCVELPTCIVLFAGILWLVARVVWLSLAG